MIEQHLKRLLCLCACCMVASQVWAAELGFPKKDPSPALFKARIGIELWDGNASRNARLRGERLLAGDQYRIYVVSEPEYWISFRLSEQSFADLREERVPDEILEGLRPLLNQNMTGEKSFLAALEEHIGTERTERYKGLILKYARNCSVYVVTTDGDVTTVVSSHESTTTDAGQLFVFPALYDTPEFYRISANTAELAISVLCSLKPVPELEQLVENGGIPNAEWKALEQKLVDEHTIELPGKLPEKSWTLAGGTRGLSIPLSVKAFLETLKISSGNSLVLKRYEFRIQSQK